MLLRLLEKPWKISSKGVSDLGQKIYEEEKRIYIYIYRVPSLYFASHTYQPVEL